MILQCCACGRSLSLPFPPIFKCNKVWCLCMENACKYICRNQTKMKKPGGKWVVRLCLGAHMNEWEVHFDIIWALSCVLILYNWLYLCWTLLLDAKWILLKTKAFTKQKFLAPKLICRAISFVGREIVCVGGVYYVWWCSNFSLLWGVCDLSVSACSELMYRSWFSFTRLHIHTHLK